MSGLHPTASDIQCEERSSGNSITSPASCLITRREATAASAVSWGTQWGEHFPSARSGQATAAPGTRPRVAAGVFPGTSSGYTGCTGRRADWTAAGSMCVSCAKSVPFRRSHQSTPPSAPLQVITTRTDFPPGNRRSSGGGLTRLEPALKQGAPVYRINTRGPWYL